MSWPGVMAPTLQQSSIHSGAVKVFWDQLTVANGADVKQATVRCIMFTVLRRLDLLVDVLKVIV